MEIIERMQSILLQPRREWPKIAAEDATTLSQCVLYLCILGSIGPAAVLVRSLGNSMFLAVFTYAFTFFEVFMLAQTVDILAPWFGGTRNFPQSLKLITYSFTALWVGDACQAAGLQPTAVLAIGFATACYGLYTFHLGVAVLGKSAPRRALPFTLLIAICMLLLSMVLAPVVLWGLRAMLGLAG